MGSRALVCSGLGSGLERVFWGVLLFALLLPFWLGWAGLGWAAAGLGWAGSGVLGGFAGFWGVLLLLLQFDFWIWGRGWFLAGLGWAVFLFAFGI